MQTTHTVLMIRPVRFGFNPDTAINNRFQQAPLDPAQASERALLEFDHYVETLREHGVTVLVVQDSPTPHTTDSIFPNNGWSTHPDGCLVLYPMQGENRRLERDKGVLQTLADHFVIRERVDFTPLERHCVFLEGTGSLVLDRQNRIAYACHSGRTHPEALELFARRMNYRIRAFNAVDRNGAAIYHSNVMMSVGRDLAIICLQSIPDLQQRQAIEQSLLDTGKQVLTLDWHQLENFAGNMLELQDEKGAPLLVMSLNAWQSLQGPQRALIERHARPVIVDIGTIERIGGGSARCMLAEVFLSRLA